MGAGRTELAMSVFGRSYGQPHQRHGAACTASEIDVSTVGKAVAHGIAYVTEDRKALGLVLDDDITHNITLANLHGVSQPRRDRRAAASSRSPTTTASSCDIRCAGVYQPVVNLSGGNQQKVVLSKWLFADPEC